LRALESRGLITIDPEDLQLSREGLLQVDKLLHDFFLPQHRSNRYA
jgi:oxygen-independent coproporphyrinogen-3 oxidase